MNPKASWGTRFRKVGAGVLAALTSPEAVKQEKSLGALVLVRVATQVGGGASFLLLAAKLLGA